MIIIFELNFRIKFIIRFSSFKFLTFFGAGQILKYSSLNSKELRFEH